MKLNISLNIENAAFKENALDEIRACIEKVLFGLDTLPFDQSAYDQTIDDSDGNYTGKWNVSYR
jgi:hypothetical protein